MIQTVEQIAKILLYFKIFSLFLVNLTVVLKFYANIILNNLLKDPAV